MVSAATATRMWAFDAPSATVDKGLMEPGGSGDCWTPFPTFLIEHSEGLVLFDTGLDPDAAGNPAAVYGENARIEYSPQQRVDYQIRDAGFQPSDVNQVVLSHLHFDHTGGMRLFPEAHFYAGEGEMRYAYWPDAHTCGLYRRKELDLARNYRWHEIPGCDYDMFGDGSITLLFLPGHSPGSLAMEVRLPNRTIILSGDVAHTRNALETASPFVFDQDSAAAIRSIKRLQLLQNQAGTEVWVGHDPDDWRTFGPGCYE